MPLRWVKVYAWLLQLESRYDEILDAILFIRTRYEPKYSDENAEIYGLNVFGHKQPSLRDCCFIMGTQYKGRRERIPIIVDMLIKSGLVKVVKLANRNASMKVILNDNHNSSKFLGAHQNIFLGAHQKVSRCPPKPLQCPTKTSLGAHATEPFPKPFVESFLKPSGVKPCRKVASEQSLQDSDNMNSLTPMGEEEYYKLSDEETILFLSELDSEGSGESENSEISNIPTGNDEELIEIKLDDKEYLFEAMEHPQLRETVEKVEMRLSDEIVGGGNPWCFYNKIPLSVMAKKLTMFCQEELPELPTVEDFLYTIWDERFEGLHSLSWGLLSTDSYWRKFKFTLKERQRERLDEFATWERLNKPK